MFNRRIKLFNDVIYGTRIRIQRDIEDSAVIDVGSIKWAVRREQRKFWIPTFAEIREREKVSSNLGVKR